MLSSPTTNKPLLIHKLVIKAHGTFNIFSDSLVSNHLPIRAQLEEEGTLCIYNANSSFTPSSTTFLAPPTPRKRVSINKGSNPSITGGTLVKVLPNTPKHIQMKQLQEQRAKEKELKKLKPKEMEIIDTSRKTIVIEKICYSLEPAPEECKALEGKKVLVPFWKIHQETKKQENIDLPDLYEAENVEYERWTMKSGDLEGETVLVPSCYLKTTTEYTLDNQEKKELILDEHLIYRPKPKTSKKNNSTEDEKDSVSTLLYTRKRRCSITDVDKTVSYSFIGNPRCTFLFDTIEIIPPATPSTSPQGFSLLSTGGITTVKIHCEVRTRTYDSILAPDRKKPVKLVARGKSNLIWNLPNFNFWPDHFRVDLQLFDEAICHFNGRLYELSAETRNQSKLENLLIYECKKIKAFDTSKVSGKAVNLGRIEQLNSSSVNIVKTDIQIE